MRQIRDGMHLEMLLTNNKQNKEMKKYISIGVLVAIILFVLSFVILTAFSNPLNCESAKLTILKVYSVFALIMTAYWIYLIVETFKSKKWFFGAILAIGLLLCLFIRSSPYEGLYFETRIIIFLVDIIIWSLYYVKCRDSSLLIIILGLSVLLLVLPYCLILWD